MARFAAGEAVLVSEPWAMRRGTRVGDMLSLPTPSGEREFPVAGIFRDYTSDRGVVALHRERYRQLWGDECSDGIGISFAPGTDAAAARPPSSSVLPEGSSIWLSDNAELRAASLAVFDRTFTITRVLQVLVGLVAFLGILSALQALQLERVRETAVLRAVGWLPRQLRALVVAQTGLLGLRRGPVRHAAGHRAGRPAGVRDQPARLRLDDEFRAQRRRARPGPRARAGRCAARRRVPAWRTSRRPVAQDLREE
jgi:putative ABC transport system permease protein